MTKNEKKTARSIEDLTSEYERLNERKIEAKTQLTEATKQLETLQKDAVEEFETSNVDELKTKLTQMETENEKRRSEYQELLEGISSDLEKVEKEAATKADDE